MCHPSLPETGAFSSFLPKIYLLLPVLEDTKRHGTERDRLESATLYCRRLKKTPKTTQMLSCVLILSAKRHYKMGKMLTVLIIMDTKDRAALGLEDVFVFAPPCSKYASLLLSN